jgi:two-component system cell cycle sensor histidine kinase/response regulator CckA
MGDAAFPLAGRCSGVDNNVHALRSPLVDELLDAPHLLDTLMDHMPDQIYFKDAKSRFVRISRTLATRWGLDDPADAVGKTDFDFFSDEHAQKAFADEQRLLQTGEPLVGLEERETWQDGREAWVSTTKVALRDRSGRIVGLFGISRDITRNKLAELRLDELREHQRRESLGVLAGGIAHDFNNLLVGIIGNADLLARELAGSPQAEMAAQIDLAGRRAADLTRQMLAYSGKGKFVVEPLLLAELVSELLPLLDSVISKKAELTISCPDGLRAMQGDATQIRQVVMNLLTNASDALDEHPGTISVTVGEVEADSDYLSQFAFAKGDLAAGPFAFVEVSDTGRGMDTQTRERIFDPYFTTKFKGSGLGLAAVRGIVQGHDGGLRITSEPGSGSSFKVLFPATGVHVEQAAAAPTATPPERLAVLLADDEDFVRTITTKMLEASGCTVTEACDGIEAVSVFHEEPQRFDCVILDLMMPGYNGEEAFARIRQTRKDVPIVIYSGYNAQEVRTRFAATESTAFLQKPFGRDELTAALVEATRWQGTGPTRTPAA